MKKKVKIGDRVRLKIEMKGRIEGTDSIVALPAGTEGVLEERWDDGQFHFVGRHGDAEIVTSVSPHEVTVI